MREQLETMHISLPGVLPLVRIATRYDKLSRNFLAALQFAAMLIWLN
jgi:transposase